MKLVLTLNITLISSASDRQRGNGAASFLSCVLICHDRLRSSLFGSVYSTREIPIHSWLNSLNPQKRQWSPMSCLYLIVSFALPGCQTFFWLSARFDTLVFSLQCTSFVIYVYKCMLRVILAFAAVVCNIIISRTIVTWLALLGGGLLYMAEAVSVPIFRDSKLMHVPAVRSEFTLQLKLSTVV
jgi:hypothetical protein